MKHGWQKQTGKRNATAAQENRVRQAVELRALIGLSRTNSGYCPNFGIVDSLETGFSPNLSLSDCGQLKI